MNSLIVMKRMKLQVIGQLRIEVGAEMTASIKS